MSTEQRAGNGNVSAMKRFALQVAVTLGVTASIAVWPLMRYASEDVVVAVVTGAVLSTVNVLAGFLAIQLTFQGSYTRFLKAVLGGMGIRMAVMLGMLLVLILVAHMHAVALTVTLVGCSMIYLVLEIFALQKMMEVKNQG
ncbi:MAG: hypothetical protein IPI01_14035 [Ignavibacteriae bacterium]|nr:hypothetical protein [Ignavibacteriota bacterium]